MVHISDIQFLVSHFSLFLFLISYYEESHLNSFHQSFVWSISFKELSENNVVFKQWALLHHSITRITLRYLRIWGPLYCNSATVITWIFFIRWEKSLDFPSLHRNNHQQGLANLSESASICVPSTPCLPLQKSKIQGLKRTWVNLLTWTALRSWSRPRLPISFNGTLLPCQQNWSSIYSIHCKNLHLWFWNGSSSYLPLHVIRYIDGHKIYEMVMVMVMMMVMVLVIVIAFQTCITLGGPQ